MTLMNFDIVALISWSSPVIQSVETQLLPHVTDQHPRQSQQGLWVPQLQSNTQESHLKCTWHRQRPFDLQHQEAALTLNRHYSHSGTAERSPPLFIRNTTVTFIFLLHEQFVSFLFSIIFSTFHCCCCNVVVVPQCGFKKGSRYSFFFLKNLQVQEEKPVPPNRIVNLQCVFTTLWRNIW